MDYRLFDSIYSFINSKIDTFNFNQLINEIGNETFEILVENDHFRDVVRKYMSDDILFTQTEWSWISYGELVTIFNSSDDNYIFFISVNCDIRDYYIVCAALIKILRLVFKNDSLFIFKMDSQIAFGSPKNYYSDIPNNFVITRPFNESNIDSLIDFLEMLLISEKWSIPILIDEYGPIFDDNTELDTIDDHQYKIFEMMFNQDESILEGNDAFYEMGVNRDSIKDDNRLFSENMIESANLELKGVADEKKLSFSSFELSLLEKNTGDKVIFDDDYSEDEIDIDITEDADDILKDLLNKNY